MELMVGSLEQTHEEMSEQVAPWPSVNYCMNLRQRRPVTLSPDYVTSVTTGVGDEPEENIRSCPTKI